MLNSEIVSDAQEYWRRQWQPTPVLLPGKSQGQKSLVGCSPWGHEESDTTEWLHFPISLSYIGKGNGNPLHYLAWRIPGTAEPGGLLSVGLHRVRHDWSDLAAVAVAAHSYITTGKTIALSRWTFVGKVTSLLFNMHSRLVITFLPRSKHLLISWLQSPSAVILEPKKIKLTLFPLFLHLFPMKGWDQMPWSSFSECWAWLKSTFHSPLSLSSRGFLVLLHFLP